MKKHPFAQIDFFLVILLFSLVGIGLAAVYSATHTPGLGQSHYFSKQVTFALLGTALMFIIAFTPFKLIQRLSYPLYGLSLFLLLLVPLVGVKGFGAERWIAIGSVKLQPSELAKLSTVLAVARFLSTPEVNINRWKDLFITFAIILTPFILIARQPDLGTSLVFLAMLIPFLFWAGLNWFVLFVLIAPLITALVAFNFYAFLIWMLIVSAILFFSRQKPRILLLIFLLHIVVGLSTPALWGQLRPYQKQRILTFANPEADPRGAGYQIIQSKVAIGSGGIWGKGFLNGTQTQLKFLPAQHTDFIFSVIGEEFGFVGISLVLFFFAVLFLYIYFLARNVKSVYASLGLVGITTVLSFHVVVNIGMTVGLAPVTGLPLPFISYGGSFLLAVMSMMGFVLNFSRNRFKP